MTYEKIRVGGHSDVAHNHIEINIGQIVRLRLRQVGECGPDNAAQLHYRRPLFAVALSDSLTA
jgi:hypothetical protein